MCISIYMYDVMHNMHRIIPIYSPGGIHLRLLIVFKKIVEDTSGMNTDIIDVSAPGTDCHIRMEKIDYIWDGQNNFLCGKGKGFTASD